MVYDVSNKGSFESVSTWLSKARSRRAPGAPRLAGVLVANKVKDVENNSRTFA